MEPTTMTLEAEIEKLEAVFTAAARGVFANAYEQAIQSGLSVVISIDDKIVEVFPDGKKRLIKMITPPTPCIPGQIWIIP